MKTLNVQKFLMKFSSREEALYELKKKYFINVKEYKNDLVILNYDQIQSPRFNEIVDECRGLILSWDLKTVFSVPYTRFYNLGEYQNKNFDFSEFKVFEKVDGSLCQLFFHPIKHRWIISTRKTAYAEGNLSEDRTYHNLFLKAIGLPDNISDKEFTEIMHNALSNMKRNYMDDTWIFELVSPENRVVKKYNYAVYLTGIRNKTTLRYIPYSFFNDFQKEFAKNNLNVKIPKIYNLNNINEIKNSLDNLEKSDEGYVCFNPDTEERVKIKNPSYLTLHVLRGNEINPKKISSLIFTNEYEEYLSYFPEDKELFEPYFNAFEKMQNEIINYFEKIKNINGRKEFAFEALKSPFSVILFEMRKEKLLIDILKKISENKQFELLKKFI